MSGLDFRELSEAKTPLEAARAAKALGFVPVPMKRGTSTPLVKAWKPPFDPSLGELPRLFPAHSNVAVVAGSADWGFVDVDLDHEAAVAFGEILFADCPSFGRGTRPRSHRQVHCPGAKSAIYRALKPGPDEAHWKGPHGTCIAEIQAGLKLVTLPPSVHRSGDSYSWEQGTTIPPTWPLSRLTHTMGVLAFMVFFDTYYPETGGRHDACLAASGALARAGVHSDLIQELIQAAARRNGDEEWQSRGASASAVERLEKGDPVSGIPTLVRQLNVSESWLSILHTWLAPDEPEELTINPRAPRRTARSFLDREHTTPTGRTLIVVQDAVYAYRKSEWVELGRTEVKEVLYSFLESVSVPTKEGGRRRFNPQPSDVTALSDALRPMISVGRIVPPTWLDGRATPPADEIVATPQSLVHAPTGMVIPPTPQLFTLGQIPVEYSPTTPPPMRWLAWLDSLWPDPEAIALVQEIMGLTLVPDTSFQKIVMFYGPPRAGKGVLTSVMQALLGPENYVSPTLASLGDQFGLQPLLGKRLAFIPDARLDMSAKRNGVTQTLLGISGEDSQSVQRKHETTWNGKLPTRFLITTNEVPQLRDDAGALTARMVPVVFTRSFVGSEDLGLKTSLLRELPGILNWSLGGYKRLKARGHFVMPTASQDLVDRMGSVFSRLGTFMDDCVVLEEAASVSFADLFRAYQLWCQDEGIQRPLSKPQFGERLNEQGFRKSQPRAEGKMRMRYGLRLNNEWARRVRSY